MKKPWNPKTPIKVIYNKIKDVAEFSNQGDDLMSDIKKITIAHNLINQTGELASACRNWKNKAASEKKLRTISNCTSAGNIKTMRMNLIVLPPWTTKLTK